MKLDITSIPELGTSIGIHGSTRQQEVAGPFCLGVLVGIAIWTTGRNKGEVAENESKDNG